MKSLIQLKKATPLFVIALLLVCFSVWLAPNALGVVPAPDGGYAGGNTAEGQDALLSLTTGGYNTALGYFSLRAVGRGTFNTAVGAGTLLANTADANTATGAAALLLNTSGFQNTATGAFALFDNSIGENNTANGFDALFNNTEGDGNTANGVAALFNNTTGGGNTGVGAGALFSNTTGAANTAVGVNALSTSAVGDNNTAVGTNALLSNTGINNTATGFAALSSNTMGNDNTAFGWGALSVGVSGSGNTAIGTSALGRATTNDNIGLGFGAGANVQFATNVICIGDPGLDISESCFIGNIRNRTTSHADAIPVLIDSFGQLGTMNSSRRFKKEIKPMQKASEAILSLKPVIFHYKSDKSCTPQFGLVAEDVAAVNPDLVVRDKDGEIYTVRYDAVNAMLLNEFLKEHRKVEELEKDLRSTIARQQKQIETLASAVQKVSAQLELGKSAPRVMTASR
jgi:hypothetical protein